MRCMPEFKKLIYQAQEALWRAHDAAGERDFCAPEGACDQLCP